MIARFSTSAFLLLLFLLLLSSNMRAREGTETLAWQALEQAVPSARLDQKPILVWVRNYEQAGSLAIGHWIDSDDQLRLLSARFHLVALWSHQTAWLGCPWLPEAGLVFLSPQGGLIAYEPVPLLKGEMNELLWRVLKYPDPLDALTGKALADNNPGAVNRCLEVYRKARMTDQCLLLIRKLGSGKSPPILDGDADHLIPELEAQAPLHLALRLQAIASWLDRHPASETSPSSDARQRVIAGLGSISDSTEAQDAELIRALKQARNDSNMGETGRPAGEGGETGARPVSEVREVLKGLFELARERQAQFHGRYPAHLNARLGLLRGRMEDALTDAARVAEVRALVVEILKREINREQLLRSARILSLAITRFGFVDLETALAEKIIKEGDQGWPAALALGRLASSAALRGDEKDSRQYLKAAERAAKDESPALERRFQIERAAIEGQRRGAVSGWRERRVLDVVVLVEDLEGYLSAIDHWTGQTFYPVLFKDDFWVPKFVEAFKPSRVILIPGATSMDPLARRLTIDRIRRTVLNSWLEQDERGDTEQDLSSSRFLEVLKDQNVEAPGLVLIEEDASASAGGLALAAGRFQGIAFHPRADVQSARNGGALSAKVLSFADAEQLNRDVRRHLSDWHLPAPGTFCALTLAGGFPFLYTESQISEAESIRALDDLLGRGFDGARLAFAGRLMGDRSQCVYQAMCSLFLRPDRALLMEGQASEKSSPDSLTVFAGRFRTMASDLKGILEKFETPSSLIAFRNLTQPWSREQLLFIGAKGHGDVWQMDRDDLASVDDLPLGSAHASVFLHPSSAAEPDRPDSLISRALENGAFWYLGAVAEPYRDAIPDVEQISFGLRQGVPFGYAFRKQTGESHAGPWRIAIIGDPLFCLRDAPAERIRFREGAGEFFGRSVVNLKVNGRLSPIERQTSSPYESWFEQLRQARWVADGEESRRLADRIPSGSTLDGPGLALVLEEDLRGGFMDRAIERWRTAAPESKADRVARSYARQAIRHRMGTAGDDLEGMQGLLSNLLETAPSKHLVEEWLSKLSVLAREKGKTNLHETWMRAVMAKEGMLAYKDVIQNHLKELPSQASLPEKDPGALQAK